MPREPVEVSRLLVVTAVVHELSAITGSFSAKPGRAQPYPTESFATSAGEVVVTAGGVGMASAAAATAYALAQLPFDAVLSMGVGGGFDGRAAIGDTVVATSSIACQLGADSPEGYLDFGELGLTDTVLPGTADVEALGARLDAHLGAVLSVETVTGTDERALGYAQRWDPAAEAMEGFGVWTAARAAGVPAYEIRTISNRVGRRDRSAWEIGRALAALSLAAKRLFEEPLL
jgi:futalosine hydrolase